MNYNILLISIIGHILGDFYFQTQKLADEKKKKIDGVFKHGGLYMVGIGLVGFFMWIYSRVANYYLQLRIVVYFALVLAVLHFLIDLFKFYVFRRILKEDVAERIERNQKAAIYIVDQSLHIATIFLILLLTKKFGYEFEVSDTIKTFLQLSVAILLLFKPTNITFKAVLQEYKPNEDRAQADIQQENGDNQEVVEERRTGKIIGNLERLLVFLLLMVNQYSAIGFIFAAKSITRYSKIVNEKEFAEYYLLGTLYSITATILIYLVFAKGVSVG